MKRRVGADELTHVGAITLPLVGATMLTRVGAKELTCRCAVCTRVGAIDPMRVSATVRTRDGAIELTHVGGGGQAKRHCTDKATPSHRQGEASIAPTSEAPSRTDKTHVR